MQLLKKLTPKQSAATSQIDGFALRAVAYLHLESAFGTGVAAKSVLMQHAAMLTMAKTLEEQNGNKVKCYAQDPANNGVGDKFLESIGITPLRDPKGFLEVDAETLFISASPDQPIRQVIADLEKPAVILWKSVEKEPQDE